MLKYKKTYARILAAIMLIAVILSSCFVVFEANHTCQGDDCRICVTIQNCLKNLNDTVSDSDGLLFAVKAVFFLTVIILSSFERGHFVTPVELKVKISN
ncbi:MAG: hypothetical protein LIO62_09140 [Clostridiales bacterium]|nr:hypothetical protein [Clostridiales bacterium]